MHAIEPTTTERTTEEWIGIIARRQKLMNEARIRWNKLRENVPYAGLAAEHESWYQYRVRHGFAVADGREN